MKKSFQDRLNKLNEVISNIRKSKARTKTLYLLRELQTAYQWVREEMQMEGSYTLNSINEQLQNVPKPFKSGAKKIIDEYKLRSELQINGALVTEHINEAAAKVFKSLNEGLYNTRYKGK